MLFSFFIYHEGHSSLFAVLQYVKVTALHGCNLVLGIIFTSDKEVEDVNMQVYIRS